MPFTVIQISRTCEIVMELIGDLEPLVLEYTELKPSKVDPNDTTCRPEYAIAFERNWSDKRRISWPFIELVGAKDPIEEPLSQMYVVSYLHYIIEARPDLSVGLGFLTFNAGITFFVTSEGLIERLSTRYTPCCSS
jgi:hypothetical protein